jgi:hypothetical protein
MRNVTITVDEEVARWARIEAAKRDTSVSRMVGEMLAEKMRAETAYDDARAVFLEIPALVLSEPEERYPRRDELHDRADLR